MEFKSTYTLKYEDVSEVEFLKYLEDIKQRLVKEAPEWHVNVQSVEIPTPRIFYHLARWDFTKGKEQTWPITLRENVFAYETQLERTFHILNQHPIEEKS